ncbi:MAG: fibro-slime domain-containing protein, partial [Fibrobacterales bacterium]
MKNLCVTIAVLFIVPFGISSCFLTSSEDESSEISSSSIAESSEELSNTNNQSSGHGAESPPSGGLSSSDEQDEGSESSDEGGEDTISSTPEDVSTGVSSGDFIEESSFEKYVGFMEQAGVCRGKPVYASHFVNFNLTVYDHDAGSDFGGGNGADQLRQGMVEDALGANGLPVFKKNFWNNKHIEEWWTEAEFPKVETTIQFVHMGDGIYSHFDNSFFPLDDESAQEGDDGLNYYFAAHMSNEFVYDGLGSRVFSFSGDDDVFVYVNGRLVIDMGGPHTSINDEFTLGEVLDAQGVKEGEIVTLDFFIAERQKSGSSVGIAMDMS